MNDFEKIYYTLTGQMQHDGSVLWVENAFAEGTEYNQAYQELWAARENLCQRFGLDWEDEDLERIMHAVLSIEQDIGRRMFESAIQYAKRNYQL